jgi:hypothetical protein
MVLKQQAGGPASISPLASMAGHLSRSNHAGGQRAVVGHRSMIDMEGPGHAGALPSAHALTAVRGTNIAGMLDSPSELNMLGMSGGDCPSVLTDMSGQATEAIHARAAVLTGHRSHRQRSCGSVGSHGSLLQVLKSSCNP